MRPLSETLNGLIGCAETIVTRPNSQRVFSIDSVFVELAREVRHADALPAEAVRCTRAALVMVIAIEEFINGEGDPGSRWLMLAGTTLPLLRAEAYLALRNEKDARAGS